MVKKETKLSLELAGYIDTAIQVVGRIERVAGSFDAGGDDIFAVETKRIQDLVEKLQAFITARNILLQQPALVAGGTATPPTPRGVESSASVRPLLLCPDPII